MKFVGHLFNWGLFGVLTVQVCTSFSRTKEHETSTVLLTDMYYLAFPSDGVYNKSIVCATYLIECVQVIVATQDGFRQFGSEWGLLQALNDTGLYWFSIIIMTGATALLSQLFYAWRIHVLSHSRWLSGFVILVCHLILSSILSSFSPFHVAIACWSRI